MYCQVTACDATVSWTDIVQLAGIAQLVGGYLVPKREKSKRLQVVITEQQDSLLTKTAYQLSNTERLVSKSEVVRLGIEMLNRAVEEGQLDPELLKTLEDG